MKVLVACLLVVGLVSGQMLPPFADCGDNTTSTPTRRCCVEPEMPNGCECFDISENSDFTNTFGMFAPLCQADMGVMFYFYSNSDPDTPVTIRSDDDSIGSTDFDAGKETKFIVHGFGDWPYEPSYIAMREAVMDYGDYNVILVDWDDAAGRFDRNFFQSVANCRSVGSIVAQMVSVLKNAHGASLDDMHLICSHLGAQVCHYAGKEVERLEGELIERLTALDAVGAGFEGFNTNVRLDKSDAKLVDVVHCDAGPNGTFGLGMTMSIGHVDFRPNGGAFQPGCPIVNVTYFDIITLQPGAMRAACSHYRCNTYFTQSIKSCDYVDPNNGDCHMGFHATDDCSGDVIINTEDSEPFCGV